MDLNTYIHIYIYVYIFSKEPLSCWCPGLLLAVLKTYWNVQEPRTRICLIKLQQSRCWVLQSSAFYPSLVCLPHALMDLHSSQLLSPFRIHMSVKFPAVTLYIPSYPLLVFDLLHFFSECSFSYSFVVLISTPVSSCAPGDFLFTQVCGSAIISSLPVQQCDLLSSSQQADGFLFGGLVGFGDFWLVGWFWVCLFF